jgi:hypothetical protein
MSFEESSPWRLSSEGRVARVAIDGDNFIKDLGEVIFQFLEDFVYDWVAPRRTLTFWAPSSIGRDNRLIKKPWIMRGLPYVKDTVAKALIKALWAKGAFRTGLFRRLRP